MENLPTELDLLKFEAQQWAKFEELNDYWYHVWPERVLGPDAMPDSPMPSIAEMYEQVEAEAKLDYIDDLRRYILQDSHELVGELEAYEEYELCAAVRQVADSLYKDAFMLYMKIERHEFKSQIDTI